MGGQFETASKLWPAGFRRYGVLRSALISGGSSRVPRDPYRALAGIMGFRTVWFTRWGVARERIGAVALPERTGRPSRHVFMKYAH